MKQPAAATLTVLILTAVALAAAARSAPPAQHALPAQTREKIAAQSTKAAATTPKTPATKQLAAWLAAYNSGNRAEIERFLITNFPSRVPKLSFEVQNREMSGGLDLRRIDSSTATRTTGLLQERDSGQFVEFRMEVEPAPPHRILSNLLGFVPAPPELAIPRLSEAEAIAALGKFVAKRAANDLFSGSVLIARRTAVLYSTAVGMADRERRIPNTLDTKFRIGSMNKMFTGIAILQLAQAGRLRLDGTLGQYVRDYPDAEAAHKVTVHHLLTHTGGTGDIFGPEFEAHRLELETLDDYVNLYGRRGLEFPPGERFAYSNYGYVLLGVIIERVSGQSYYDYVDRRIYRIAGMSSSNSLPENVTVPGRSVGYTKMMSPELHPNTDTLPYRGSSAGGGYSTAKDLMNFANALLDHKLLDERHTKLALEGKVDAGDGFKYAYGFGDFREAGLGFVGHNGGAPGMNGDLRIFPVEGYIVVALANRDPIAASTLADFVAARLPLAPAPPAPAR